MDVADVPRLDAMKLGLIDSGDEPEPQDTGDMNDGMEADVSGLDEDVRDSLVALLGDVVMYVASRGVLKWLGV